MEGNEIENLGIRIKQQIAEKIDDFASIQSEPLRKEIERLNAELTRANARIEELVRKYDDLYRKANGQ